MAENNIISSPSEQASDGLRHYCVYVHISPNGKAYVGMTGQTPERRWNKGLGYLGCPKFHRAIQKYGWDAFEHIVLMDGLTEVEAHFYEEYYIDLYDSCENGYNCTPTGEMLRGHLRPKEVNERIAKIMSESRSIAVDQYDMQGNYIATYRSGTKAAEQLGLQQTGISACIIGKHITCGGFLWTKHGEKPKQEYINYVKPTNGKAISQYTKGGEHVCDFPSLAEAERQTGVPFKLISKCLCNEQGSAGGYIWRYAEEEFWEKPSEKIEKTVSKYTLDGDYVETYPTIAAAAEAMNTTRQNIASACNGGVKSCFGFQFRYDCTLPKIPPCRNQKKRRPIICINDGKIYKNCGEAARAYGIPPDRAQRSAGKNKPTRDGYHFQYLEDYNKTKEEQQTA